MIQCPDCGSYNIAETLTDTNYSLEEYLQECADCGYQTTVIHYYGEYDAAEMRPPMISFKTDIGVTPMRVVPSDYGDPMRWWL